MLLRPFWRSRRRSRSYFRRSISSRGCPMRQHRAGMPAAFPLPTCRLITAGPLLLHFPGALYTAPQQSVRLVFRERDKRAAGLQPALMSCSWTSCSPTWTGLQRCGRSPRSPLPRDSACATGWRGGGGGADSDDIVGWRGAVKHREEKRTISDPYHSPRGRVPE
jgi:hypothetical protein